MARRLSWPPLHGLLYCLPVPLSLAANIDALSFSPFPQLSSRLLLPIFIFVVDWGSLLECACLHSSISSLLCDPPLTRIHPSSISNTYRTQSHESKTNMDPNYHGSVPFYLLVVDSEGEGAAATAVGVAVTAVAAAAVPPSAACAGAAAFSAAEAVLLVVLPAPLPFDACGLLLAPPPPVAFAAAAAAAAASPGPPLADAAFPLVSRAHSSGVVLKIST